MSSECVYAHFSRIQGSTPPGEKRALNGRWFEGRFVSHQAVKAPQGDAHPDIPTMGDGKPLSLQGLAQAALTPYARCDIKNFLSTSAQPRFPAAVIHAIVRS